MSEQRPNKREKRRQLFARLKVRDEGDKKHETIKNPGEKRGRETNCRYK